MFVLTAITLLSAQKYEDFSLPDINNNEVKLSEHIGKGIVILDFWATWCQPCVKLLPEMDKIHQEFEDVTVIAINVDNPRLVNKAKGQVRSQKYSFVTLFDTNQTVMKKYRVSSIPQTFVYDTEGKVIYEHSGYTKGDETKLREIILANRKKIEQQVEEE
jgi:thiol-disulfide isomerase/thioredoxin